MPQSPATRSPLPGRVPITGIRDGHFFQSVSVGILGALFGVVAVSGTASVIHSSGTSNSTVDVVSAADVVPAPTVLGMAESEIPSAQPVTASATDEMPATAIPEVSDKNHEADSHVELMADEINVAERRILEALSEQSVAKFADTPLVDVVEYLQRLHDIPIMLDTISIEEAGLLVDEPMNLILA